MNLKFALALFATLSFGSAGAAVTYFEGKVALVQPTYLPAVVSFTMTAGNTFCPAGAWLQWKNADQSNNKAVYATLLAAFMGGKSIRLYVDTADTSCTGVFMHVID